MSDIKTGNASLDSIPTRGWFVGSFLPDSAGIVKSADVEIKWGAHKAGESRATWVTGETRTAVSILVSGTCTYLFRDQEVTLTTPGDYVAWGVGTDHTWQAVTDCVVITVRWPSISAAQ